MSGENIIWTKSWDLDIDFYISVIRSSAQGILQKEFIWSWQFQNFRFQDHHVKEHSCGQTAMVLEE